MSKDGSMACGIGCKLSFLLILLGAAVHHVTPEDDQKFYVVYLGDLPQSEESAVQMHIGILSTLKGSDRSARNSLVHSYTKNFNAFAAKLSEGEAEDLSRMDEVLLVAPNRYHKLHTTRSWDFLGLHQWSRRNLKVERDIIVGVLDTGITPRSESFKDTGLGPPPKRWKGTCGPFANFSGCNNKLIGARYFKLDGSPDPSDILSPLDTEGHGTHTSSTAVGTLVPNASFFGLAKGTARGAVPSARVAIYKVCWEGSGCGDMDILAAFDAAIDDGVDVISISIGGFTNDYVTDSISVGAFHAMRKGIITAASAGNEGPDPGSLSNYAPWMITVAASGIDREFRSEVELGNRRTFSGIGVNAFKPTQKMYPLVSGKDVAVNADAEDSASFCLEDSMDPEKVKGKLVHCRFEAPGADSVVKGLGGIGIILESSFFLDVAQVFMAPATMVNETVGQTITDYIHSTRSPSAVIYRTQEIKIPAPFIASFSSRGPTPSSPLLKPDIAAPGIDILASYTLLKSVTGLKGDTQFSKFNLLSGTSMACPHVAGVAAYVKSFHHDWTPAAIKSAIMTTGQVNPIKALNPGLVYDMDEMSYVQFLCHEGFEGSSIAPLVGLKSINCSSLLPGAGYDALNYPTMQLNLKNNEETLGVFLRTVTNVGPSPIVYNAAITAPEGVEISVEPMCLSFAHRMQKRSFKVVVKAKSMSNDTLILSGSLIWKNFTHRLTVRSPIVVYRPAE